MQVHCDDMIATSHGEHIRDEFCGNRSPRLVLLVHPRIRETGYDSSDASCRRAFTSGDEDEEFHEVVVDVAASGLNDEDVFFSYGL